MWMAKNLKNETKKISTKMLENENFQKREVNGEQIWKKNEN